MASPLDNLTSINKGSKPATTNDNNSSKKSKKKFLSSPFIKELRGVGAYVILTASVLGTGYYFLSDETSDYYVGHLTEERKLIASTEQNILNNARQVEQLINEVNNLSSEIQEKERIANEASLIRTPLEQGFYFTAYLDALATKFDIDIVNLDIQYQETGANASQTPVPIEQANVNTDYSLLPISVEMQGSYDSIVSLFNDIYTKRLIYDRNLKFRNNSDGTVTVTTLITFNNKPVIDPNAQQQPGMQPQGTLIPGQEQGVATGQVGTADANENGITPDTAIDGGIVNPGSPPVPVVPNTVNVTDPNQTLTGGDTNGN